MSTTYENKQRAKLVLGFLALCVVIVGAAALLTSLPAAAMLAIVLAVAGYLFSSMTIVVGEKTVRWHFGPGFWRKSVPLREIESVQPVRNKWWYGWGIRITPHGWLYNIDGLDAVELTLKSGKSLRLGTDEPQALAEAIRAAMRMN